MTGLIPYPGKPSRVSLQLLPLTEALDWRSQDRALAMFRDEGLDTRDIAWRLEATEAAVANGIADARERERAPE